MNLSIFDPKPLANDYLTKLYFTPMRQYAADKGIGFSDVENLADARNSVVLTCSDYLKEADIDILKNNGCKIVAFNIVDSSYVSQHCRSAQAMKKIDLMFSFTGIQTTNIGRDFVLDDDLNLIFNEQQFLPKNDWEAFDFMRKAGRLQSIPYAHWLRMPRADPRPYSQRSQKVLIRGGPHMRRVLLAFFLMRSGLLDINSGFLTRAYFMDYTEPRFRHCDGCRTAWRENGESYPWRPDADHSHDGTCGSPAARPGGAWSLSNLGHWNNRCPRSFYWLAERFKKVHGLAGMETLETLFNARVLTNEAHLALLSRMAFTSDLKWLHSIYAAQRFWDGAMVGCINLLPARTAEQEYFPAMTAGIHYLTFNEDMQGLKSEAAISESRFNEVSRNARALYEDWMRPSKYAISTNLIRHVFEQISKHAAL